MISILNNAGFDFGVIVELLKCFLNHVTKPGERSIAGVDGSIVVPD